MGKRRFDFETGVISYSRFVGYQLARERRFTGEAQQELRRLQFLADRGATQASWTPFNITRLLRSSGESPQRIDLLRGLVELGKDRSGPMAVWDHGMFLWRGGR